MSGDLSLPNHPCRPSAEKLLTPSAARTPTHFRFFLRVGRVWNPLRRFRVCLGVASLSLNGIFDLANCILQFAFDLFHGSLCLLLRVARPFSRLALDASR